MMTLDTTEILLIRACKSQDSLTRIRSVIRRMYILDMDEITNLTMRRILVDLVQRINPIDINNLLDNLNCYNDEDSNDSLNFNAVIMLRDQLRFMERDQLDKYGYIAPLKFRIKIKNQYNIPTSYRSLIVYENLATHFPTYGIAIFADGIPPKQIVDEINESFDCDITVANVEKIQYDLNNYGAELCYGSIRKLSDRPITSGTMVYRKVAMCFFTQDIVYDDSLKCIKLRY
jgi:hypothetical protein